MPLLWRSPFDRIIGLFFAIVVLGSGLCTAGTVLADELSEFQVAKAAFDDQRYAVAADLFRSFVESKATGSVIRSAPRSRPLMLEAYKYLGACRVLLNQPTHAEVAFRALLREEPDYAIDPVAFPRAVVDVFNRVRLQMPRTPNINHKRDRALRSLIESAESQKVRDRHSRWIAAIPFGVGQFQNENQTLGTVLLVAETSFFLASVVSFWQHQSLRGASISESNIETYARRESTWRALNWISSSLFLTTAIGGVIEAQLNFKPEVVRLEKKPLPREWLKELSPKDPSAGGSTASAYVTWTPQLSTHGIGLNVLGAF